MSASYLVVSDLLNFDRLRERHSGSPLRDSVHSSSVLGHSTSLVQSSPFLCVCALSALDTVCASSGFYKNAVCLPPPRAAGDSPTPPLSKYQGALSCGITHKPPGILCGKY